MSLDHFVNATTEVDAFSFIVEMRNDRNAYAVVLCLPALCQVPSQEYLYKTIQFSVHGHQARTFRVAKVIVIFTKLGYCQKRCAE